MGKHRSMSVRNQIYNAEISAGSLMLRESRKIAALLRHGADEKTWHKAFYVDNILQKKVPSTARRMARLIRNRLKLMTRIRQHVLFMLETLAKKHRGRKGIRPPVPPHHRLLERPSSIERALQVQKTKGDDVFRKVLKGQFDAL